MIEHLTDKNQMFTQEEEIAAAWSILLGFSMS